MAITEYEYLSAEQRAHFLEHGWIRIEQGVPKENIDKFTENVWVRLGYDPNDKSTWLKEKVNSNLPHISCPRRPTPQR